MTAARRLPALLPGMAPMAPKRNLVVAVLYALALAIAVPAVPL